MGLTRTLLALIAAGSASSAAGQALYGKASPITLLDKRGFAAMQTDPERVWVVEFYADWCGHCKQFAPAYEKAAASLAGLVGFAGVNADKSKDVMRDQAVSGYPTIKVYLPGLNTNGKLSKKVLDYDGPRTAKALVDFVSARAPNLVVNLSDEKSLAKYLAEGAAHLADAPAAASEFRAILISAKDETSLLLKSLALRLSGRLAVGEARRAGDDGSTTAIANKFGISTYPSLLLLRADAPDAPPEVYSGEMKYAQLWEFLEAKAGPAPDPPAPASSAKSTGSAAARRSLSGVSTVTDSFLEAEVVTGDGAWVLAFEQGATDGGDDAADAARIPALSKLAGQLRGQANVGLVNASEPAGALLAARFGVTEFPALRVLPYGEGKSPETAIPTADIAAARKSAGESLPVDSVQVFNEAQMDGLFNAAATGETLASCVLFTDKTSPPPLIRALALNFKYAFSFGMVAGASPNALGQFQLSKMPALLCLWPNGAMLRADRTVDLTGAKYDESDGPMGFNQMATFLADIAHKRGGPDWLAKQMAKEQAEEKTRGPRGGSGKEEEVVELTAANFEEFCGEGASVGLCAIGLLDGDRSAAKTELRAAQLRTLSGLAARRRGDPAVRVFWLDATCHDEFAPALDISDADLPTMAVISPSKKRFAKLLGTFTVEGTARFVNGVVSGRVSTSPFQPLPKLDGTLSCDTTLRGAAKWAALEAESGEDEMEDTVAEILAEEEERRRALLEELAADKSAEIESEDSGPTSRKDKGEMSEMERLEAELEECGSHDLLCSARRDKQLRTIEKRRALEEQLRKIAKAKKKKTKKRAQAN